MTALTDTNFEAVALQSATPVLIDFGARWCPPCRAMEPHVEAVATAYAGRVTVLTCDTDHNPRVAQRFGVQGLPTFVVLRGGEVVDRAVGAMPRARLDALVRRALGA